MSQAKNPNALLIAFRKYHSWLGLAATAFIVVVSLTGIYLNHKDLFRGAKPKEDEAKPMRPPAPPADAPLTTATDLAAVPVSFPHALAACRAEVGDSAVERIELRAEKGRLVYKIKTAAGEFAVDADSGEAVRKGKPGGKGKKGEDVGEAVSYVPVVAREVKEKNDWGKWIKDLHTGKLGGLTGKLLVDLTALGMVALSLTGVYLWAVPAWRKRRTAQIKAAAGPTRA